MAYIPDNLRQTRLRDEVSRAVCEIYEEFCEFANNETGFTFVSIERVADICQLRHNCARVYLKELFTKGWLIETFGDDGNGKQIKGVSVKTTKTGWLSLAERSNNFDKKFVTAPETDKNFVESDKKIVNDDKKIVTPYKESLNHKLNQETNQEKTMSDASDEPKQVFSFWQSTLNHEKAKFTAERKQKIVARIRDGYSVEQIKTAILGCRASPFHQGENKDGTKHDDLTLICRNGSHVEKFIGIYEAKQNGAINANSNRNGNQTNGNGANLGTVNQQGSSEYLAQLGIPQS